VTSAAADADAVYVAVSGCRPRSNQTAPALISRHIVIHECLTLLVWNNVW
jgi:hypothetical protein